MVQTGSRCNFRIPRTQQSGIRSSHHFLDNIIVSEVHISIPKQQCLPPRQFVMLNTNSCLPRLTETVRRPQTSSGPVPTRAVVGMAFEMLCGFNAITVAHYAIISSHIVQTTAFHISREAQRTLALMMLSFTGGWMITYTLHISPVVYRDWMWATTSILLLVNLRNTIIFGCCVCDLTTSFTTCKSSIPNASCFVLLCNLC